MITVVVGIDYLHAAIGRRNLQHIQQMPPGTTEIEGFPVEQEAVGGIVETIIPASDTLVTRPEQVFMLTDHAEAKMAIHCDNKLRKRHVD